MKQTAVEWLVSHFADNRFLSAFEEEIKQAKEMEKQQIVDAVDETNNKWRSQKAEVILNGNQYYNKKFNK